MTVTKNFSTISATLFLYIIIFVAVGVDYRTISQDFTIQVPSGPRGRYCVNVTIIDDRVADEGIETFALSIGALPQGARLCSAPDVAIRIIDTDSKLEYSK